MVAADHADEACSARALGGASSQMGWEGTAVQLYTVQLYEVALGLALAPLALRRLGTIAHWALGHGRQL